MLALFVYFCKTLSHFILSYQTEDSELFTPSYAVIRELDEGDTIARKNGVELGDCVVAVNGVGYRRLTAPDDSDFILIKNPLLEENSKEQDRKNKKDKGGPFNFNRKAKERSSKKIEPGPLELNRVILGKPGENYSALLTQMRNRRQGKDFTILMERYGWDHRVHSWARFLRARNKSVPLATAMLQQHEDWRERTFPIDLGSNGIKKVFASNAISELDFTPEIFPPSVYVNFGKLTTLYDCTPQDIVDAFVVVTETLLSRATDPRHPKTCQFIDMANIKISSSFKVAILKKIYSGTF